MTSMISDPPVRNADLRKNVWKIFAFVFFQTFLVLIPVIVPFWQSKGLSIRDVFTLQAIFGATLIVFDVPAGYVADLFGRKKTLVVGSLIAALGFQILWFGQTFGHFVIYEFVLGVGLSLQSGCDVAILYNSLDQIELAGRKAKFLGQRLTAQTIGEGIASILGGLLAGISLQWPAYVNAVTAWIPLFIALSLSEPPGLNLPRGQHMANVKAIGKALFGHSKLLTWAIVNFIFYGFATYCAVWILQPFWAAKGLSLESFGYLWAANSFMVALVGRYAHKIEEGFGTLNTVVLIAFLPIAGYFGMAYVPGWYGLAFAFAFPVCRGLNQIIFQDAINKRVPAEMRATTNSIGSLGMRTLFIIFGPLIGFVLDRGGPTGALTTLGVVYSVGFVVIALPLLGLRRYFNVE
jgi:MFS family permease